ncbi:hypothetical protein Nmel_018674, partial [Mimus melanotis]
AAGGGGARGGTARGGRGWRGDGTARWGADGRRGALWSHSCASAGGEGGAALGAARSGAERAAAEPGSGRPSVKTDWKPTWGVVAADLGFSLWLCGTPAVRERELRPPEAPSAEERAGR